jgi:HEAT repeat protein
MKLRILLLAGFSVLMISVSSYAQDKRTIETKVVDLLAQLPANDTKYLEKLMSDMFALGETGIREICDQIVQAGTGDDTRARFAVESLSRYLSMQDKVSERPLWEKICIQYATGQKNNGVKDFFMKQLQLVGSNAAVEALKASLNDKEMCGPALAALQSIGGKNVEAALAESLKNKELPCAAAVMNALAGFKSQLAVNEYIEWSKVIDVNTRASAYNALAQSASSLAYPVLSKAARDVFYRWEHTGATASLLDYAKNLGDNSDLKTMDKICKLVMSKCKDRLTVQNKTKALLTYVSFHGAEAMKELTKAAEHSDKSYRNAAIRSAFTIPGDEIVKKWIAYYPKAIPAAKSEIIAMLGDKGNKTALTLVTSSLSGTEKSVRCEAARALTKINGSKAVPSLIEYLKNFTDAEDQQAAKSALMSVSGNNEIALLRPVLKDGPEAARKSVIELLAWNKGNEYFSQVLPYTSSDDVNVRSAAFKALADLAGPGNQADLIELMLDPRSKDHIPDLQAALASAAGKIADPEKRSEIILKTLQGRTGKEMIIPVLAKTGGREALTTVLKEFENGNPEMRDICFKTITSWQDYTASSALYEICASGNKTFEGPAFEGYVKQIRAVSLPDEEKLLLFRKIMPYALSPDRKNEILTELCKLKTYQTLFLVANYLDDPSVSAEAANAAMHIALPSVTSKAGMYGSLVRDILAKAVSKLTGPEVEYNREMINKYLASIPPDEGFKSMFNGKDLTGWQGLVGTPLTRARMRAVDLERMQAEANVMVPANWSVKDGCIWFNGKGENLCSVVEYGDFEMIVDWKISKDGDSGIYLRGTPQVQIWDTSRTDAGAQVGSGGLYNNQINPSKPLKVADNPVGDWNTFRIVMIGEKVSVWLNGELVVDNVTMENYWDKKIPIFTKGPIELQAHGTDLGFRDIYIREISDKDYNLTSEEKAEGFVALFNGKNLDNWVGNKQSYVAEDGMIVIKPESGSGGNLYTEEEYADFIFRFEFQLTPAANNGLGIRAPLEGDAAYVGMELQILDNTAPVYANLQPYQYHGSVYGVIPARREYLKPIGEWNYEEVEAVGTHIKITLNGTVIVDGNIAEARDNGAMDHNDHPGLKNKTGHIGFLGHGSVVKFRNIRIKDLTPKE